jgi:hypothetical protein
MTIGIRRSKSFLAAEALKLPTPRLQFRWERIAKPIDGFNWVCYYELVMKLDRLDIRNPREYKRDSEVAFSLGTTRVGSTSGPLHDNGSVDTPFRDGAHMQWDAKQLKIKHRYSIFGNHVTPLPAALRDPRNAESERAMSRVKHNHPLAADFDERCGWCRSDMQHTQYEHDKAVAESKRKEGERQDALLRAAKKQYDQP